VGDLRDVVAKYPDDPEAWFLLGEFYRHLGTPAGLSTEADELEMFEKAVQLDPTFTPYYIHFVESLVGAGRGPEAAEALATYEDLAPGIASPAVERLVRSALSDDDPDVACYAWMRHRFDGPYVADAARAISSRDSAEQRRWRLIAQRTKTLEELEACLHGPRVSSAVSSVGE